MPTSQCKMTVGGEGTKIFVMMGTIVVTFEETLTHDWCYVPVVVHKAAHKFTQQEISKKKKYCDTCWRALLHGTFVSNRRVDAEGAPN